MGVHPGEPKRTTFCARHFFERLRIACTKKFTAELMDVSGLWNLNEKKVEELLYLLVLSGILELKYDLDRTGMKKKIKRQKLHALE